MRASVVQGRNRSKRRFILNKKASFINFMTNNRVVSFLDEGKKALVDISINFLINS